MFEDCREFEDKRTHIVCEEKRTKITFRNSTGETVAKIRIDGCVITGNAVKKCDYLLLCADIKTAVFVELKGKDVITAIEQLSETLGNTIIKPAIEGYTRNAYAVVAQGALIPKLTTMIQNEKTRFRKRKDCRLEVVTSPANRDLIGGKVL
jgi:Icc-related predicted phosphoesterase